MAIVALADLTFVTTNSAPSPANAKAEASLTDGVPTSASTISDGSVTLSEKVASVSLSKTRNGTLSCFAKDSMAGSSAFRSSEPIAEIMAGSISAA